MALVPHSQPISGASTGAYLARLVARVRGAADAPAPPNATESEPSTRVADTKTLRSTAATLDEQAQQPSMLLGTPEARRALSVLQQANIAPPTAADVMDAAQAAQTSSLHGALLQTSQDALLGRGEAPSAQQFAEAYGQVYGHKKQGETLSARNMTAYVFLVMLEAQKEATQEKRCVLSAMKMYAEMQMDLDHWLNQVVLPAQRSLNQKIKEGVHKDSLSKRNNQRQSNRDSRVEELVAMPGEVDTQWGAVDPVTGRVYIPALAHEALTPQKMDAQDLASLVTRIDQWRTTLQNNQNKESLNFKRIDDAMSAAWQQLSGFLKTAQDGANAIIRNGLG